MKEFDLLLKIKLVIFSLMIWSSFSVSAKVTNCNNLLVATSSNSTLKFSQEGVSVSSPNFNALNMYFVEANPVIPVVDSLVGVAFEKSGALCKVRYNNLWDNVDLLYESIEDGIFESTYFVQPGKNGIDVDMIRIRYDHMLKLDANGNLLIVSDDGIMSESAPIAWQIVNGQRHYVEVAFNVIGENEVGFSIGNYCHDLPIIIDPKLSWNTFLGGVGDDKVNGIELDSQGNIYVCGCIAKVSPQVAADVTDAFLVKFNPQGVIEWKIEFGGCNYDIANAIDVDSNGDIYVGGNSSAKWGDALFFGLSNGFVAKFSPQGNLIWNRFMESSGSSVVRSIVVNNDNVCIGGYTNTSWGTNIKRKYSGQDDGFVAKLSADNGELKWNCFIGSKSIDIINAIDIDDTGNVYFGGVSYGDSWGQPIVKSNVSDCLVGMIDSEGNLLWHTFAGASNKLFDKVVSICLVEDGFYTAGLSKGTWGSPINNYRLSTSEGFIAKYDLSGNLQWNTFVGGAADDVVEDIAVNKQGKIVVCGTSCATWGNPQNAFNGFKDGFITLLEPQGKLISNTFLGGKNDDNALSMIIDKNDQIYLGGNSNGTWGVPIQQFSAEDDGFVAKFSTVPVMILTDLQMGVDGKASCKVLYENLGSSNLSAHGVCWNATASPNIIADNKIDLGLKTNNEEVLIDIDKLSVGKTYYVRAFGTNIDGTSYSNEMSITIKAVADITWNNPLDIIYGTELNSDQLNATANIDGAFEYTPIKGAVLGAGDNQKLSLVFTPTKLDDYGVISKSVSINVVKAPLVVTADDASVVSGKIVGDFSYKISGFVNNEDALVVTGLPVLSADYLSSDVGDVVDIIVNVDEMKSDNYDIKGMPGKLTITSGSTGVASDSSLMFSIYPNPLKSDQLTVCLKGFTNEAVVSVLTLSGEELGVTKANSVINYIDVPKLQPGVYLLRISSGDDVVLAKFVKQ